jgi:hypothetical protein
LDVRVHHNYGFVPGLQVGQSVVIAHE